MDNSTQELPLESQSPLEILASLAEASKAHRLAPADEERGTALLKDLLTGGKAGITSALEPMLALPWVVSVNAVGAAWPGLSLPMRRHLLAGLAKSETEQARRLRLSVARAVFKLEPAAGLKIAAAAAADLKDAQSESGALPPRHRQIFFHVFVGKGKPWLLQLPLAELKGAEADALVHAAIETFPLCPPLSQLSILRWVHGGGRLKKLSEADLAIAVKSVGRWNARLQHQLKREVPELPEAIVAVLKPEPPAKEEQPAAEATPPEEKAAPAAEGAEEKPQETQETGEPQAQPAAPAPEAITIPGREERLEAKREKERAQKEQREQREQREQKERERREERASREGREREPREPEKGRKPFDFKESLRGLESYVQGLKNELEQTRTQLRRREEELKRGGGRHARAEREERHPVDTEALVRHNAQLESTVQELRQQLEDLASNHEAVAESRRLHGDEPLPEGTAEQLKALLAIKLKESFETYSAMRLEPLDRVFRLDYRDLLGSVFDVLQDEGVRLENKK